MKINIRILGITMIVRLLPILMLSFGLSYYISQYINTTTWLGLIAFVIISCLLTAIMIYLIGIRRDEKIYIHNFIKKGF